MNTLAVRVLYFYVYLFFILLHRLMRSEMVRLVRSIFLQSLFSALVATQGQFVVPSGPDGSNTYTVGSMLTIVWTGTESYSLLSLGINSLNNSTVTWLICMVYFSGSIYLKQDLTYSTSKFPRES